MARKKFNEFLKEGGKLSYDQLRELNSVWKQDYMNNVIQESNQIQEYLRQQQTLVGARVEELQELQHKIQAVQDTWEA